MRYSLIPRAAYSDLLLSDSLICNNSVGLGLYICSLRYTSADYYVRYVHFYYYDSDVINIKGVGFLRSLVFFIKLSLSIDMSFRVVY